MNNRFVKFISKHKDAIISVLISVGLAALVSIVFTSHKGEDNYIVKQPPKQEQKKQEKKPEQQQQSDVDKAYDMLEGPIAESFSDMQYVLSKEERDNMVMLYLHIPLEELEYTTVDEWNYLKESCVYAQTAWQEVLFQNNVNTNFVICVGDMNQDLLYLTVANGQVAYDRVNQIECKEM